MASKNLKSVYRAYILFLMTLKPHKVKSKPITGTYCPRNVNYISVIEDVNPIINST